MSKIILKIVLILVVIFLLLFLLGYLILKFQGKNIIEKQLASVFTNRVTVGAVSLRFPLSVSLKNLEVKDFLKTNISVSVNPLGFLSAKIVLNKIVLSKPQLSLVKDSSGVLQIPLKPSEKKTPLPVILGLLVRQGEVIFIDKSTNDFQVNVYDINLKVGKRGLNTRIAFNFEAAADIGEKIEGGENFKIAGWIDWTAKDMDAALEVKDLNTNYVIPVYKNLLGSEASPAIMNAKSTFKAKDNDLKVNCHMELSGLRRQVAEGQEPEAEKQKETSLLGDLTDLFSSPEGKILLDFTFNTKLDNPKFNKADIAPNLIGNAAQNILSKSPEDIVSTVEKIGEKIKTWGEDKEGELKDKSLEEIINIFR